MQTFYVLCFLGQGFGGNLYKLNSMFLENWNINIDFLNLLRYYDTNENNEIALTRRSTYSPEA